MKWHVFILALLSAVALFVNGQCLSEDDNVQHIKRGNSMSWKRISKDTWVPVMSNMMSRNRLYKGQGIFTLKLLEAINEATSTENIIFSPYSLYHVLLMVYFGAKSDTEKILRKGLELHGTDDKPLVWQAYNVGKKSLAERFTENSDILFTSVDKMFFDKTVRVEECMKDKFFDDIEMLDFGTDPESQRVYINNWVENNTRGEIKDLLVPGALTKRTILAVANAAYFKGIWQNKFNPERTKPEIFYVSPGRQIFVDMMHVEGTFNHAWNRKIGCNILELPYKDEDKSSRLSMFVLLPPAGPFALDKLLSRLHNTDILSEVVGKGIPRRVDVKLPKFSIEQSVNMKTVLGQLGMGHIFEATADFTGFSKQGQVGFEELQQKSKITVNEEGSTAASATIACINYMAQPDDDDPTKFHCNRPFIFLIYDYATQAVHSGPKVRKAGKNPFFQRCRNDKRSLECHCTIPK